MTTTFLARSRLLAVGSLVAILHAVPVHAATPIRGTASWYAWHPGEAAAGPSLRAQLGPKWRGQVVTVRANGRVVRVRLTDWCQCLKGTRSERTIDLDVRAFARLADPARGLVRVEVSKP